MGHHTGLQFFFLNNKKHNKVNEMFKCLESTFPDYRDLDDLRNNTDIKKKQISAKQWGNIVPVS